MWRIVQVKTEHNVFVREPESGPMHPDTLYKLKRAAQSEADVMNHPVLRGKKPVWHYQVEKASQS